jgi:hypothetical protein
MLTFKCVVGENDLDLGTKHCAHGKVVCEPMKIHSALVIANSAVGVLLVCVELFGDSLILRFWLLI